MTTNNLTNVDHAALKINQAVIIILNITAFILDLPWLAGIVALAMLTGTLLKSPGFKFVYQILKAGNIVKPDVLLDNPEPHFFAQEAVNICGANIAAAAFSDVNAEAFAKKQAKRD